MKLFQGVFGEQTLRFLRLYSNLGVSEAYMKCVSEIEFHRVAIYFILDTCGNDS